MNYSVLCVLMLIPFCTFSQMNKIEVVYPLSQKPKAVCLLIHGLNYKPSKMNWVRQQLLIQESIVVSVALSGHGDSYGSDLDKMEDFKQVSWRQWMLDVKPAVRQIDSLGEYYNIPKCFAGYSLGGLVGANIHIEYDFDFDAYFFIAPALDVKLIPKLFINLLSAFPRFVVPSKTPADYRENRGTPIAAYKALLQGVKSYTKSEKCMERCFLIVDKHDELIKTKRVLKLAKQNGYQILVLNRKKGECFYCNKKHLITDPMSLGNHSATVIQLIELFISNKSTLY